MARNPIYDDVQFFDAARGGSAILQASAEVNFAQNGVEATRGNYWFNEATGTDGPNFGLFDTALATWAQDKTVLGVIWDQGQADTQYVSTAERAAAYTAGLDHVLLRLMALSGAAQTYIQGVGDRAFYSPTLHGGADLIHQIQQDFVGTHSYAHLVTNTYDLALKDSVHLTTEAAITAALRMSAGISTGLASPVLETGFLAQDGKLYLSMALEPGQTLLTPAGLAGFRWNGQAVGAVVVDSVAGLVVITPTVQSARGVLTYASVTYSFAMGGADVLMAGGPTGPLPVQPFTRDLSMSGLAVAPRPGATGGYTVTGTAASDAVTGFGGSDSLFGQAGDDVLDGGRGRDRLYGGAGADMFVFRPGMSVDKIYDFDPATDRIALIGFDFDDLRITPYGARSTDIRGPDGERVNLWNVAPFALTGDCFVALDETGAF